MSIKDSITKEYMKDKATFADAFNFFLYSGSQIIDPGRLSTLDINSAVALRGKNKQIATLLEKERDVLKSAEIMTDGNAVYAILGIENQSYVDYSMPVRNMLYDSMQYFVQVEELTNAHREKNDLESGNEFVSGISRQDRITPVITLVIYWGPDNWDGSRSLHEMFDTTDETMLKYASNYELNLITPADMQKGDFKKFKTELGRALKYIKNSGDVESLKKEVEADPSFKSISRRTADMLNIVTNSDLVIEEKGDSVDMCKAIQGIREEGIELGRAEGKAEGKAEGLELGKEKGTILTLYNLAQDGTITLEIAALKAGLSESEFEKKAKEYLEK